MYLNSQTKVIILFSLTVIFLFIYLGKLSLVDPDEARYAESAREMIASKDVIVPHLNFQPRINKPIVFYWLISISYKIFGINEFAARFPSAVFGLVLILGVYFYSRKEIGEKRAFLSSLILLSSPAIFLVSKIAITDMVYTSFIMLSLFSFWRSLKIKKFLYLGHLFLGLSLSTKGPAGVLLILLTLIFYSIWQRDNRLIKRFFNYKGILILLLTGSFWYLLLINKVGWLSFKGLMIQETWGRIIKGFIHREPFFYYILLVFIGFLPWSVFLIEFRKIDFKENFMKFIFLFGVVTFLFFSATKSKMPTYILPAFPALAILTADILVKLWDVKSRIILVFFVILFSSSLFLFLNCDKLSFLKNEYVYQISIFILLLSLPMLFLFNFKLKYNFWYLFSLPFLIYFYLILSFGNNFSNYRSCKGLFKNRQIASNVVYTWRLYKPSITFYSQKRTEELNDFSNFKNGYLVVKKKDIKQFLKLAPSIKIISQTQKYYLLKKERPKNNTPS